MPHLEKRARMHAALGEPVRLAIVDRLALGDASPGELADEFTLATNLLAHHLGVLETAGLVHRIRSEGDRRRSYVTRVIDDPDAVTVTGNPPAGGPRIPGATTRVVFVCSQNSARSQLAAAVWARASDLPAASAGTRPAAQVHPQAISAGRRHGLDLGSARTARIEDVAQTGDLLVAVCDNAHEELPADRARLHWALADPVRIGTDAAFDAAYEQIAQRVDRLASALRQPPAQPIERVPS